MWNKYILRLSAYTAHSLHLIVLSRHSIPLKFHSKMASTIPNTQTVALVRTLGGPVEFVTDYPVPVPKENEVLAKILYTGVCQSGI